MVRIGGGNKPPSDSKPTNQPAEGAKSKAADAQEQRMVNKFKDTFGRQEVQAHLKGMSTSRATPSIIFNSEALEEAARKFAALLRKNPGAERKLRAKLFAKAFLKRKKGLGDVLEDVDEEELESLYDAIAEQLETSPKFAQLVDEVTEGARKITL